MTTSTIALVAGGVLVLVIGLEAVRRRAARHAVAVADSLIAGNRARRCVGMEKADQGLAERTKAKRDLIDQRVLERRRELEDAGGLVVVPRSERRAS